MSAEETITSSAPPVPSIPLPFHTSSMIDVMRPAAAPPAIIQLPILVKIVVPSRTVGSPLVTGQRDTRAGVGQLGKHLRHRTNAAGGAKFRSSENRLALSARYQGQAEHDDWGLAPCRWRLRTAPWASRFLSPGVAPMTLETAAHDLLFREARTHNKWQDKPVTDEQIHALYDLLKFGPTRLTPRRRASCSSVRRGQGEAEARFVQRQHGKNDVGAADRDRRLRSEILRKTADFVPA